MWDRNPVRLSLLHMLPHVAERHGVELAPLLGRAGLPADGAFGEDRIVTRAQICTLLLALARRTGDPTIGQHLAAAADASRLGLTGRALFVGRTLRECLLSHARMMPGLQDGVMLRLDESNGLAHWHHRLADSDAGHARILNEGIAGFVASAVRAVTGMAPQQLNISLPHRAEAPVRIYEEKLGAGVTFGGGDGIVWTFEGGWLDQPNLLLTAAPPGDDPLGADPAPRITPHGAHLDDDALLAALPRLFESSAFSGSLGLTDAARSLGLSPRSLQRRLTGLGTSFETLVDAWRHRQACLHLATASLPVGVIARALGYRDPAHFVRAFRRWEGRAPLAFRHAAQHEGSTTAA